jgi:hypothetical protein
MIDVLKDLKPPELAAFYKRIADSVDKNRGELKISLAAMLMRHWLDNRDSTSTFEFEAPDHLKDREPVLDELKFHRKVFLTQKKARINKVSYKWAGVLYSLRGFQLKSTVIITSKSISNSSKLEIHFQIFMTEVSDRYDWDYSEHI